MGYLGFTGEFWRLDLNGKDTMRLGGECTPSVSDASYEESELGRLVPIRNWSDCHQHYVEWRAYRIRRSHCGSATWACNELIVRELNALAVYRGRAGGQ